MKTIKELNKEAASWIAYFFLKNSESILKENRSPCPLSLWDKNDAVQWIPERVWTDGKNPRWYVSDRNWPKIHRLALEEVKQVLRVLGIDRYPLCLAYWKNKNITLNNTKL